MLAIEYSIKEFFNSVIMVRWEWLLATIIVVGKMLASRLESRSHLSRNAQRANRNSKRVTRNSELCT